MNLFYKPKRLKRNMKAYYRNRKIITYILAMSLTAGNTSALEQEETINIEEISESENIDNISNLLKETYLKALKEILKRALDQQKVEEDTDLTLIEDTINMINQIENSIKESGEEISESIMEEIKELEKIESLSNILKKTYLESLRGVLKQVIDQKTEEGVNCPLIENTIEMIDQIDSSEPEPFEPETSEPTIEITEEPKIEPEYILDFSDIPVYDGTKEASIKIAQYIREKVKDIPNSIKEKLIFTHFKLAMSQFDVIAAVIYKEGKAEKSPGSGFRYEDSFFVTNSVYNRLRSSSWIKDTKRVKGKEIITLYDIITSEGQYEPYVKKTYTRFLGLTSGESYQAVVDCLFVLALREEGLIANVNVSTHPYTSFRGNGKNYYNSVQIVPRGNKFAGSLTDTIPLELRDYYEETNTDEIENLKASVLKYIIH